MLASGAVHVLLTEISVWPLLSFHHHPFTPRSLAQVCVLRESSVEHPYSQCTCVYVPCSSLLYAICPALSPVPGTEQGWGPCVLHEWSSARFSSGNHLPGLHYPFLPPGLCVLPEIQSPGTPLVSVPPLCAELWRRRQMASKGVRSPCWRR